MPKFLKYFKKQGGMQLLSQYLKLGILPYAMGVAPFFIGDRVKLEIFRNAMQHKTYEKLRKKFFVTEIDEEDRLLDGNLVDSSNIWFFWLQGVESAPRLVKNNLALLKKNAVDFNVVVLDLETVQQYVDIPGFILEKYDKGIISNTHLSDIIRLLLLETHGGMWIDSTVAVSDSGFLDKISNERFFVPMTLKPGKDGKGLFVSNWLISAQAHDEVTKFVLFALEKYWQEHDELLDYFIFHYFLQMAFEKYPQHFKEMPKVDNSQPHALLIDVLDGETSIELLYRQSSYSSIHKLSNKVSNSELAIMLKIQEKLLDDK